jgi:hypothetical protein
MGDTINSICFKENNISWVQAEIDNSQRITIKKVVESPLPFIINYDNIQKPTTALQIANHIKSLANTHELSLQNMRFLLSAKFAIIKKIRVDQYIPLEQYSYLLRTELGNLLTGDIDDYLVYQPDYARDNESDSLKEFLAVTIRKNFFTFIQQIDREANLSVTRINLNCFSIDEIYRRFFPNMMGQTLLVNFAERGFEFVISDESNFLNYIYKPYSKSLQNIDQLDEQEILSNFNTIVDHIQHPDIVDLPLYSFSHIFLFGRHLKSDWLNILKQEFSIPVKIFDPASTTEWQIVTTDENFKTSGAYRFVEPLSNIF